MYSRHALLNLNSIVSLRLQTINKIVIRSSANSTKKHKKSSNEENENVIEHGAVKTIIETGAARKAEWEKLPLVRQIAKKYLPSQLRSVIIFIFVGIGYVVYEQVKNDYRIKYTFRYGSGSGFKFKEDLLLERKSLLDTLTSIVTPVPDKLVSSYYIIVGEHGSGKTTLIRQAARNVGRGVIYVDVPSNVEKFGYIFARAIQFNFKENIRLSTWIESKMFGSPPEEGKRASYERVILSFQKYAIHFKKKYGCVPVLIFDNCDSLAQKDPKMLELLQDLAKTAIDDSTWITVFVGSIGQAPEQMEGRSSITRASSFVEITDLSEEEAITYLTEKRHLSNEIAKEIYALFGGRINRLQQTATQIEKGATFSDIRSSIIQDTTRRIEKIRCRTNSKEEKFIFNILCGLLRRSELTVDELVQMEEDVEIRQKILDELRNETILTRNVANGAYIFHGKVAKVCVEEFYKEKKCLHCKWIKDMKF